MDGRQVKMEKEQKSATATAENELKTIQEEPEVLEEIVVEELSIDGVCGVY
jgi:mycofactocin precursor